MRTRCSEFEDELPEPIVVTKEKLIIQSLPDDKSRITALEYENKMLRQRLREVRARPLPKIRSFQSELIET